MSKRWGMYTDSERRRLYFNKGCSGCLTYIFVFPFELIVGVFGFFMDAISKGLKFKGKSRMRR